MRTMSTPNSKLNSRPATFYFQTTDELDIDLELAIPFVPRASKDCLLEAIHRRKEATATSRAVIEMFLDDGPREFWENISGVGLLDTLQARDSTEQRKEEHMLNHEVSQEIEGKPELPQTRRNLTPKQRPIFQEGLWPISEDSDALPRRMTTLASSRMAHSNKTIPKYTSPRKQPAHPGERLRHAIQRFTEKFIKESKRLVPVTFHGRLISRPISHEIELFGSPSNESRAIPPLGNPGVTFEGGVTGLGEVTNDLRKHEYRGQESVATFDVPWSTLLSNPHPSKVVWKQSYSGVGRVPQSITRPQSATVKATFMSMSQQQPRVSHHVHQRKVPRQCLYAPTISNKQGCDVHFLCRRVRRVVV